MTSHHANYAIQAWETGRRRRAVSGAIERVADAIMAAGAVLLANAALPIRMGLPEGRFGVLLGASLLCAGLAWISRHRAQALRPHSPAYATMSAPVPVHCPQMAPVAPLRRAA